MSTSGPAATNGAARPGVQAAARRARALWRGHPWACGIGFVLLVTALSMLLTLQGWKSRVPAFDLLTYVYAAHDFIESGALPRHGDTGSYGSYKPPGTAWLMVPGVLLLGDPRVSDYVGTGLLHFATLLGMFLLGSRCFGVPAACLAVLLYGLSSHGIFLAGSLWPNGRPDFYIWFVLLTSLWTLRRDARWLAAALAVWALGMHVDMAIAPAFFILPLVWLYYRPPVRLGPLLVAGLIVMAVWTPYLQLQATRGFADIKSQLFLRNIFPPDYKQSWCDENAILLGGTKPSGTTQQDRLAIVNAPSADPAVRGNSGSHLIAVKEKVLSNFAGAVTIPGASVVLLLMVLTSLTLCSMPSTSSRTPEAGIHSTPRPRWLKPLGLGLVLLGIVTHESIMVAGGISRSLPKMLVLVGLIFLAGPWLGEAAGRAATRVGLQLPTARQPDLARLLVLCLVVPWLILILVAEPGKPERFWWLWPLQVLFLAALVAYYLPRLRVPRAGVAIAQLAVALVVIVNPFLGSRLQSWWANGWTGADAEEVQVIDYVAGQIQGEGKTKAAIGYQLFIYPFMARYHITNPLYKVGGELELLLKYRHGIGNTDQCAEGVSPADEYRIVQTRPLSWEGAPEHYFDVLPDKRFRLLRRFDMYEVLKRDQ